MKPKPNDQMTATKRPTRHDPDIVAEAAKALTPAVLEWLGGKDVAIDIERELARAMRHDLDGYCIAKRLYESGWSPDAALVDALDYAGILASEVLEKAEIAWLATTGMQPPALESRVRYGKRPAYGVGIVTRNWRVGCATVCFPDLGHVRECIGTNGEILPWEDLTTEEASETVEERAKTIYDAMRADDPEGKNRPWVQGGNSDKQNEARRQARLEVIAELEATSTPETPQSGTGGSPERRAGAGKGEA